MTSKVISCLHKWASGQYEEIDGRRYGSYGHAYHFAGATRSRIHPSADAFLMQTPQGVFALHVPWEDPMQVRFVVCESLSDGTDALKPRAITRSMRAEPELARAFVGLLNHLKSGDPTQKDHHLALRTCYRVPPEWEGYEVALEREGLAESGPGE